MKKTKMMQVSKTIVGSAVSISLSLLLTASAMAAPAKDVPGKKAGAAAQAHVVKLDLAASTLGWTGKKVTGSHTGIVKIKSGEVMVEGGAIKTGTVVVDMASITDEDIKDPAYNAKLIGHLKSDDFFSVEKNPTAVFTIKSVKPVAKAVEGQPNSEVSGDLMIKGKTLPVTFPAMIIMKDGKAQAKGTMTVDRTKYDIRYNSGKFFPNLGDKVIHDEFTIDLNLVGSM